MDSMTDTEDVMAAKETIRKKMVPITPPAAPMD